MELLPQLSSLVPGLIGALIGGSVSLYTTHKSHKRDREKEIRREQREVHNLLIAMQTEISTLWQFHMRRVGDLVENLKDGDILKFYYPLTQDYFTIYHASARQLGKVRNGKLRSAIVVCYNKCKKVVDGFKFHNGLLEQYMALSDSEDDSPKIRQRTQTKYAELQECAKLLKEDHYELKGYVEELIHLIDHNH